MPHVRKRWLAATMSTFVAVALLPGSAALADPATGALAGHLVDGTTPVAHASITVLTPDFGYVTQTTTDDSGAFAVADLQAGQYQLNFVLLGGYSQAYHHKRAYEGDLVTVTPGGTTAVEETVLPHGSLAGTVRTSSGEPHPYVNVSARAVSGDVFQSIQADAAGEYLMPYVAPGTYTLVFIAPSGGLEQAAHQKVGGAEPDHFEVTVGATTTVDEQFLPAGAITGRLTAAGQPVFAASVRVISTTGPQQLQTSTDADGRYRVAAFPGSYTIQFTTPEGLTQYAHGKLLPDDADVVTVVGATDTVVDEHMLPTGVLTGRLTDATGQPVAGAQVGIEGGAPVGRIPFTDNDGRWQITVFADTYRVSFTVDQGTQYAHGKISAYAADPITVGAGQTVTVDDTLAASGSVTVTARDASNGHAVMAFCAYIEGTGSQCTQTGTATIVGLPGTYRVRIDPDDPAFRDGSKDGVVIASGHNTTTTVDLTRGAKVTTVVKDAATGAPVANICVQAVPTTAPYELGTGTPQCSDATGNVVVEGLAPAQYNLFAWADDGVHGHQWVGKNGGVGSMQNARVVSLAAGQTVAVPPILVDKRATITGVISNKDTGAPVPDAVAAVATKPVDVGSTRAEQATDANGRYTFDQLGPYDWTLFFRAPGLASEWSGHTANRLTATLVKAKVGKPKTYNVQLTRGVALTGLVTGPNGPVGKFTALISAMSAQSFDQMGYGYTAADGTFTIRLLGKQDVKLRVNGQVDGLSFDFFYAHAPDAGTATTVTIPKNRDKVVNITIPAP